MSLRINQNIAAMNTYRNLAVNDGQMAKSLEKLSSGFRINRAADDASGLVVSEGLRSQVGGLKVAVRNAQDGISVVQTAEGALNEVHSILQRMRDLSVQASNTGSQDSAARGAAQAELTELNSELTRIGASTKFGNTQLLNGNTAKISGAVTGGTAAAGAFQLTATFEAPTPIVLSAVTVNVAAATSAGGYQTALQNGIDAALTANNVAAGSVKAAVTDVGGNVWKVELSSSSLDNAATTFSIGTSTVAGVTASAGSNAQSGTITQTFQIGANSGESIGVSFQGVSAAALGTSGLDLVGNASSAITAIDAAISQVSTNRGNLGAVQNRFEHTIANLNVSVENISASESRIRDVDMAQEMVSYTRNQIMTQAGTAMLAQANSAPQGILQLLRG